MSLSESEVDRDPITQFDRWWHHAKSSSIEELNAMTLATASSDGWPSARIVYLRGVDDQGFIFFTNYHSLKGRQLLDNPRACLVFFWKELERQVRISGEVKKIEEAKSDEYFASRPEGSRIGAWSSPQSQIIPGRDWLDSNVKRYREKFHEKKIERPAHWGGYRLRPSEVEFWQGRANRLHDRIQYRLDKAGSWIIERLAP